MIEITFPCGFVLICKNDRQIIINNIKDIINNNWVNYRICFEDLKLFGKSTDVHKYYKTNLRNSYEKDSLGWILNYSVVK